MHINRALFVGMYPNNVNKYCNVFFQNLIFAIADKGIDCTVISPVPITRYLHRTFEIPKSTVHVTPKGSRIKVYYPRYVSASSKQIGPFNTEHISEYNFLRAALSVSRKLTNDYDFVYGHFFLYGGLVAVRIGREKGIPSFIAYGECDFASQVSNTYGIPKERELSGLSGIISVSTKNTNELNSLGIVKNVPIITAPNSTDLTLFYKKDKYECREKFGLPKDSFIVGFVGGFIERKGDKRLLDAINQIDGAYVAFAGRGANAPSGEKVLFCKALEHETISDFLNAVDVFCLPTLSEGSCNAIVEAMACGLPIISSDLPFNDDFLDENNSIRIDPMSIQELVDAITTLRDSEILRDKLGLNALNKAKELDIAYRADRVLSFIEDCISHDKE